MRVFILGLGGISVFIFGLGGISVFIPPPKKKHEKQKVKVR